MEQSTQENKNIKNIDNSQKGNPRALQVTTHLGLAIQSKLMLEICIRNFCRLYFFMFSVLGVFIVYNI